MGLMSLATLRVILYSCVFSFVLGSLVEAALPPRASRSRRVESLIPKRPCVQHLSVAEDLHLFPGAVKHISSDVVQNDVERSLSNTHYLWNLFLLALVQPGSSPDAPTVNSWPSKINVQRAYHVLQRIDLYTLNPENGQSFLNMAVQTRSLHMVKFLLKLGFDPNFTSPVTGEAALHIMAGRRFKTSQKNTAYLYTQIGQLLLQHGADVNLTYGLDALPLQEDLLIKMGVRVYDEWKKSEQRILEAELDDIMGYKLSTGLSYVYSGQLEKTVGRPLSPKTKQYPKLQGYPAKKGQKWGIRYSKDQMDFLLSLDQKIQALSGLSPLHMAIEARNVWATDFFIKQKARLSNTPTQSLSELVHDMYGKYKLNREALLVYQIMQPHI